MRVAWCWYEFWFLILKVYHLRVLKLLSSLAISRPHPLFPISSNLPSHCPSISLHIASLMCWLLCEKVKQNSIWWNMICDLCVRTRKVSWSTTICPGGVHLCHPSVPGVESFYNSHPGWSGSAWPLMAAGRPWLSVILIQCYLINPYLW